MCIRVEEHLNVWRNVSRGESAFADHLIESDHSCGRFPRIHHENNYFERLASEEIDMIRHWKHFNVIIVLSIRILPENSFDESIHNN